MYATLYHKETPTSYVWWLVVSLNRHLACLQVHPYESILASCSLDPVVRLWSPEEEAATDPAAAAEAAAEAAAAGAPGFAGRFAAAIRMGDLGLEGRMGGPRGGLADMMMGHMQRLVRLVGAVVEGVEVQIDGVQQEEGQQEEEEQGHDGREEQEERGEGME